MCMLICCAFPEQGSRLFQSSGAEFFLSCSLPQIKDRIMEPERSPVFFRWGRKRCGPLWWAAAYRLPMEWSDTIWDRSLVCNFSILPERGNSKNFLSPAAEKAGRTLHVRPQNTVIGALCPCLGEGNLLHWAQKEAVRWISRGSGRF